MPTKKQRCNITLDPSEIEALEFIAKRQHKSVAGLAKELIFEALERHEDMMLSVLADERLEAAEKKGEKTVSDEDAWK